MKACTQALMASRPCSPRPVPLHFLPISEKESYDTLHGGCNEKQGAVASPVSLAMSPFSNEHQAGPPSHHFAVLVPAPPCASISKEACKHECDAIHICLRSCYQYHCGKRCEATLANDHKDGPANHPTKCVWTSSYRSCSNMKR